MQPIQPKFKLGDIVARNAFTDCFGKPQERIGGLTVTRVQYVPNDNPVMDPQFKPYYRVTAHDAKGWQLCEGAERFFSLDG